MGFGGRFGWLWSGRQELDEADSKPVPASLREAVRDPSAPVAVAPFGQDDRLSRSLLRSRRQWMRRLGTGTGFAGAKLSEVLPRSERSLATVRMTQEDWMRRLGIGTGFADAKLSWDRNLTP